MLSTKIITTLFFLLLVPLMTDGKRPDRTNSDHLKQLERGRREQIKVTISDKEIFSHWSKWSRCSRKCKKVRKRICLFPLECEDRVLKDVKPCGGHLCKDNTLVNKESQSREALYSQWSEWSPCTRSCKTRRYRTCYMCKSSVEKEEKLCSVKGSACEKLYQETRKNGRKRKSKKNKKEIRKGKETTYTMNNRKCGVSAKKFPDLRIIGGHEAQKGRWPWQVVVMNRFHEPFCGGTVVASQWILTAAHCVRRRLYIRAGEHDVMDEDGSEQEVRVADSFVHPNYDSETVDSDVALLKLRHSLSMNVDVWPVCLPSQEAELSVRTLVTILGWGKSYKLDMLGMDVLHEARVPIANVQDCQQVYDDHNISDNMICAGYKRGRVDSCDGDSGGPLLYQVNGRWEVHGVISFGQGCGEKRKYGVYAKVSKFVKWIKETIELNS
ncbi:cationic trypsin-like isoform X2 [Limulus polyphemus]|uniref:Cationic trypsin-like isoform X2 n=1 Tax=Limulus polyphemus TaxID=6850 RepID=A0ABM1B4Q6_LIMPO|nr:cationic trypsin-like isoform X2 [Limulus polyphemus]